MKRKIKRLILIVLLMILGLFIIEIIVVKSRLKKPVETELKSNRLNKMH